MCGFSGIYRSKSKNDLRPYAQAMADALAHRGPDDAGLWCSDSQDLVLGHRRLSILDLSPAGHQPMHSGCGRFVIVFNGEIYNHLELRSKLEACRAAPAWRGHSDTETLLACFSTWGLESTLKSLVGMFALALWDKQTKTLTFARDRLGEKPLYWGWQGETLIFGSELKALKAYPGFHGTINRDALALLVRHGCIAAPYSIYRDIHKLRPGHYISLTLSNARAAKSAKPVAYWSLNDSVEKGLKHPFRGTPTQAIDMLEQQLGESVRLQMLSDVPLGAFLSGGIDSSTIVALMQAHSRQPVRTFTIGFDNAQHDESAHARAISKHLNTQHTELHLDGKESLDLIPDLPRIYDEPFADSSQLPTYLVCKLARRHVAVALSGDAGDELFGGYNTYQFVPALWKNISRAPASVRRMLGTGLSTLPASGWDKAFKTMGPVLSPSLKRALTGEKMHKLAENLSCDSREAFYRQVSSHWKTPEQIVIGAAEPKTLLNTRTAWPDTDSFEHWMMAMTAQTYMTDDILVKVDRAAMANSLEVRIPMLDHRIVELAWRMPLDLKIRGGQGKWLLRNVLYRHVPRELVERPKKGFSVPLAAWLRGPLRDWAEALLDANRLHQEGFFNPAPIRQAWDKHLGGQHDFSTRLWCILMFQAWHENEKKPVRFLHA